MSNWQYSSIGLDNGLALTRWQAIIWTKGGYFIDAYVSLCLNELRDQHFVITAAADGLALLGDSNHAVIHTKN